MSYYSDIHINFFGEEFKAPLWKEGPITAEMLLAEARAWLEWSEWKGPAVKDIMDYLLVGFKHGKTQILDFRCFDIDRMFRVISKKYPTVTLRVWGCGEDYRDVWTREFRGGDMTFGHGPFDSP